jgi:hypothetical protein
VYGLIFSCGSLFLTALWITFTGQWYAFFAAWGAFLLCAAVCCGLDVLLWLVLCATTNTFCT